MSLGILSILVSTFLLTLTYFSAYLSDKKRYLGIWTFAWALYTVRFVFQLMMAEKCAVIPFELCIMIGNITALLSAIVLLYGVYIYVERKIQYLWIYSFSLIFAQIIYSYFGNISIFWSRLPVYFFIGAINIWIGYLIYYYSKSKNIFVIISSISFVLWGIHKIDYPFMRSVEWFAPWGFALSAFLQIIASLSLLITYLYIQKKNHANTSYKLEAMFHNSFQLTGLLDLEGRLLRANKTALKSVNVDAKDIIGKFFWECPWWTHSKEMQKKLREAIQSARSGRFPRFESTYIDSQANLRIVDFSINPFRDEKGKIIYLIPEGRDITELAETKIALSTAAKIWQDTFDSIRDMVYVVDANHIIINANKQTKIIFGDNVVGCKCYEVVHDTDYEGIPNWCFFKKFAENFQREDIHIDDVIIKECHYKLSCYPVWDKNGNLQNVVHVLSDLTSFLEMQEEKLAMEKELQQSRKMEAIGTLAGGIAHDFNNVLAVVLGHAEMLKMSADKDSNIYNSTTQIIKAADRAKNLVKQILTFSRHSDEEMKPMYISSHVKETIKLLQSSIPKSVSITYNVSADVRAVLAEPTKIHQIVTNLSTNAMHAMEEKGNMHIVLENLDISDELANKLNISGSYVHLSVSDTGCGVPDETKSRIFDPFYTTKPVGKGTGMGLSVVHGIVQEMGGIIDLDTKEGEGSTFHIYLPTTEETIIDSIVDKETPVGNGKIMLVDDEPIVADIGKEILKMLGYSVRVFNNPLEALNVFRENPDNFDLLITDQSMPYLTGDELIKEILIINPDIPIILSTGYSSMIDEKESKIIGVKKFLMKPLNLEVLADAVEECLTHKP